MKFGNSILLNPPGFFVREECCYTQYPKSVNPIWIPQLLALIKVPYLDAQKLTYNQTIKTLKKQKIDTIFMSAGLASHRQDMNFAKTLKGKNFNVIICYTPPNMPAENYKKIIQLTNADAVITYDFELTITEMLHSNSITVPGVVTHEYYTKRKVEKNLSKLGIAQYNSLDMSNYDNIIYMAT
jgi:hypothetical protein